MPEQQKPIMKAMKKESDIIIMFSTILGDGRCPDSSVFFAAYAAPHIPCHLDYLTS